METSIVFPYKFFRLTYNLLYFEFELIYVFSLIYLILGLYDMKSFNFTKKKEFLKFFSLSLD
jgi:hypothetical protein